MRECDANHHLGHLDIQIHSFYPPAKYAHCRVKCIAHNTSGTEKKSFSFFKKFLLLSLRYFILDAHVKTFIAIFESNEGVKNNMKKLSQFHCNMRN